MILDSWVTSFVECCHFLSNSFASMRKGAVDLTFSEPQEKFPALLAALLAATLATQRIFENFIRFLKIHEISEKLGVQGATGLAASKPKFQTPKFAKQI